MTAAPELVGYADFGRAFVEAAVTPGRVAAAVRQIAGDRVELGPLQVGPAGVAEATARGAVGAVDVRRHDDGDRLGFAVRIAVALRLDVVVADRTHCFDVDVEVPLRLAVATSSSPALVIEVAPPRSRDVQARVRPQGLQARLVGRAGAVDVQVCQQAARFVRERLELPLAREVLHVELDALIERAWPTGAA